MEWKMEDIFTSVRKASFHLSIENKIPKLEVCPY